MHLLGVEWKQISRMDDKHSHSFAGFNCFPMVIVEARATYFFHLADENMSKLYQNVILK